MPFINKLQREDIGASDGAWVETPGEKCFVFYKRMMDQWRAEKRWTTADRIYKWVRLQDYKEDWQRAKELAWQVFFIEEIMPYERKMKKKNGAI